MKVQPAIVCLKSKELHYVQGAYIMPPFYDVAFYFIYVSYNQLFYSIKTQKVLLYTIINRQKYIIRVKI